MGQNVAQTVAGPTPRALDADEDAVAADIGLVARRLAEVARMAAQDLDRGRDAEAAFAAAATEHERRTRASADRTEGRLSHTTRASDGQDRTAGMLGDAVALMMRRLDDIERKIGAARAPSGEAAPAAEAPATRRAGLERSSDEGGPSGRGQTPNAQLEAALRGVEKRLSQASERIGPGPGRAPRHRLDPRVELTSAIEEIRSRQSELEQASANAPRAAAGRSQTELLRSLRDDFARLAGQMDKARPAADGEAASGLREEIEGLRETLGGLATRQEIGAIEHTLGEIGRRLDEAVQTDRDLSGIAQPLAAVQAEMRRLTETVTADVKARASLDLNALTRRLDSIAESGVSRAMADRLSDGVDDLRDLLKDIADPHRIRSLAEQVAALNHQVAQVRRQFGASDFTALAASVEEIRSAVTSGHGPQQGVAPELERLSARIDGALAVAGNPVGVDALIGRLDSLNESLGRSRTDAGRLQSIEDMLRGLAERPTGELDGLERQMAILTERIDHASQQPGLASLDRSMRDLLAEMERLRGDTAEAAERAVRSAVIHTLQSLPAAFGTADLETLQDELAGLKAAQDESGKWTQDTLAAVHVTLDKVISRLTLLDEDRAPAPAPAEARLRDTAPRGSAMPSSRQVEESLRKLEAELVSQTGPDASTAERLRELAAAEEILIEPGQGHPQALGPSAPAPATSAPAADAQDIKANFIAAARRAAQAASEPATPKDRAAARRAKGARRGGLSREGGNLAVRVKHTLDKRRRPILLGFASLVLALGAAQVIGHHFSRPTQPTVVASPRSEAKTALLPAPREPLAGPAPEAADPRTTAALPSDTAWEPKPGPSSQALADLAAREREAALADAKSSARLDLVKGETAPAPTLERIPNMASVGPIPANAGPASLRQAALAGDPAAVYELAVRAAEGRGMARDLTLAARLFEKAAAHGLAPAQYRTGNLYEKGLGVTRDLATAKGWYQRAADKGNARAMHNLAVLMAEGVGGKPDYATAIAWFRRAAQHGIRDSQFNLAVLLARGLGTPQDLVGSYTWFAIVASQGDEDAAKKRDEVAARLGAAELANAKLAVERWRPESPDKWANEVLQPAQGWSEAPQPKRTASVARL